MGTVWINLDLESMEFGELVRFYVIYFSSKCRREEMGREDDIYILFNCLIYIILIKYIKVLNYYL